MPTHACNAQVHNQFVRRVSVLVSKMKEVLSARSQGCTDLQSAWVIEIVSEIQYAVSEIQYAVCEIQYAVCEIQYAVCEIQYAVCEIQYAVCEIRYAVSDKRTRTAVPRQVILLEWGNGSVLSWVQAAQHALPAVHYEMAHTGLL